MNLAFQALLILAMLLPGMIFRSAYNRGVWNFPLGRLGPASEQIPKALIHALWINSTWALIAHGMHGLAPSWVWAIDFRAVACWVSNDFGRDQGEFSRALAALVASPIRIFAYVAGLYGFSWLTGETCHHLVRWFKLDRKYVLFRFDHEWHYLFRGEVLDFPDPSYSRTLGFPRAALMAEDHWATVVAAVVELKETSYIYLGVVVDYFFDEEGNLDRLLLDGARRRKLVDPVIDAGDPGTYGDVDQFQVIKGHYFVLRMNEIRTMNIDYLTRGDVEQVRAETASLGTESSEDDESEPPNPGWIPDRRPSG